MNITLLTDQKPNSGGIWTSIKYIENLLSKLGHKITIGTEVINSDFIWMHEVGDIHLIQKSYQYAKKNKIKMWAHVHDYRYICLTGRKYYGDHSFCHKKLDKSCFSQHLIKGCGKGKNPIKLINRYLKNNKILRLLQSMDGLSIYSDYLHKQLILNGLQSKKIKKIQPLYKTFHDNHLKAKASLFTIIWVGRTVKDKGIHEFIKLIEKLSKKDISFMVKIVGTSNEQDKIQQLIDKNNLSHLVELLGWISEEELKKIYNTSHLLVFNPIWPEPLGLVGLEALSAGTSVLTNNAGGIETWSQKYPQNIRIAKSEQEYLDHILDLYKHPSRFHHDPLDENLDSLKQFIYEVTKE